MIYTIILRYIGTALQFVVLSVMAKSASVDDYGLYVLCLGITFSYYYVVGLGTSESGMARMARDTRGIEDRGAIVGSVLLTSAISVSLIWIVALAIGIIADSHSSEVNAIIFVLLFVSFNGMIFNISQILLGFGRNALGSFFFYPATNLALLFSTVPTALLLDKVSFLELTVASLVGSAVAAGCAVATCFWIARGSEISWSAQEVRALIVSGIGLTLVRIMHVVSFWIPTMVTGFMLSPASAGLMGTAGRLAIAVSAVIAAIRFVIRPSIARALVLENNDQLKRMAGSVAFMTTSLGAIALILNMLFGEYLMSLLFGARFIPIVPVLSVFLVSVCAEGIFGPVDEILKLGGFQKLVAMFYGFGLVVFVAGCTFATYFGLIWVASLQVLYVFILFLAMNIAVHRKFGFFVLPIWPDLKLLRNGQ
jgi:O-antigen/teichoic acid export membrane protein